jgi:hypothetical protein
MKKLLLALAVVALTGCSTLDTLKESFLMKYDTNEYAQISSIRTTAELSKESCDKPEAAKINATSLAHQTALFKNHTEFLPYNTKVIAAAGELDKIAVGLVTQYQKGPVSPAFCKIKFGSVAQSAETMQKIIGAKPR